MKLGRLRAAGTLAQVRGSAVQLARASMVIQMALLLPVALLTGCAGRIPETRYYLLSEPQEAIVSSTAAAAENTVASDSTGAAAENGATLRLVAVRVPDYLQTRGLVVALVDSRIQAATYHQWAEPLVAGLERYLGAALNAATADAVPQGPPALLTITLNHLHGSEAGLVVLDAEWELLSAKDRSLLEQGRVERVLKQDRPGYPALLATHRRLLDGLAGEIVAQWRAVAVSTAPVSFAPAPRPSIPVPQPLSLALRRSLPSGSFGGAANAKQSAPRTQTPASPVKPVA